MLPLFALMLVVLMGFMALAIDVSNAYADLRFYRATADSAALAGAQDLQVPGSRAVGSSEYVQARAHALSSLESQLGATSPSGCDPSANIVDCALPGTPYLVSIKTPSPSCKTCDPARAVQVTIRHPNYRLSFARLFGSDAWNLGITSVAGLTFAGKYAIMTLQPPKPKPNGTDANLCKNVVVSGNGTVLNVIRGDIGTNTSATTTNMGKIILADGYRIDHIDDLSNGGCQYTTPGASWATDAQGRPVGRYIGPAPLLQDPMYRIASFTNAQTFNTQQDGETPCSGPDFPSDPATLAILAPGSGGQLKCYKPGVYAAKFSLTQNVDVAYLMPGAYLFKQGMKLGGTLGGGLIDGGKGVALVFPQTETLDPNNAKGFLLNTGSASCTSDSCRARPAVDSAGLVIATPSGPPITIEVPRDERCFSGPVPVTPSSPSVCSSTTVSLGGNGLLRVAGVIYAPSDNVAVAGNSSTTGYVGQVIGWTVTYSGQGTLDQDYPEGPGNGILRIDAACSGPGEPCNP